MIADLSAILWKETRSLLRPGGSKARMAVNLLAPVVMLAIALPIQMREEWLTTAWPLVAAIIIPLVVVAVTVPESFAGERERHTLETLLASRLSDRAILFGKLSLSVAYGVGMMVLVLLISLVTVNALAWGGQVQFYRPILALAYIAVSLLMSSLVASLGVLISLRVATVQAAQQTLVSILLVPLLVLQLGPFLLMSTIPNGRAVLGEIIARASTPQVAGAVLAAWAMVDSALLALAMARFHRARLILS